MSLLHIPLSERPIPTGSSFRGGGELRGSGLGAFFSANNLSKSLNSLVGKLDRCAGRG